MWEGGACDITQQTDQQIPDIDSINHVGLMLGQRCKWWHIKLSLVQRLESAVYNW